MKDDEREWDHSCTCPYCGKSVGVDKSIGMQAGLEVGTGTTLCDERVICKLDPEEDEMTLEKFTTERYEELMKQKMEVTQ